MEIKKIKNLERDLGGRVIVAREYTTSGRTGSYNLSEIASRVFAATSRTPYGLSTSYRL